MRILLLILTFLILSMSTFANNLKLSLGNHNTTVQVQWDSSWRNNVNADGVWLFFRKSTLTKEHLQVKGVQLDNQSMAYYLPADFNGVFIFKGVNEVGKSVVNITLTLTDEGNHIVRDSANFVGYGLEMVYIPNDGVITGVDGVNRSLCSSFSVISSNSSKAVQYVINSTNGIKLGALVGQLNADLDTCSNSRYTQLLATRNGKPYNTIINQTKIGNFFIMKRELTQAEYVEFLNSVNVTDGINRMPTTRDYNQYNGRGVTNGYGYGIVFDNSTKRFYVDEVNATRPVNWINWVDMLTYLDWAGLRPMTELEYEKSAQTGTIEALWAYGDKFAKLTSSGEMDDGSTPQNNNTNDTNTNKNNSEFNDNENMNNSDVLEPIQTPKKLDPPSCLVSTNNQTPMQLDDLGYVKSGNINFNSALAFPVDTTRYYDNNPININGGKQKPFASYYGVENLNGNLWELTFSIINNDYIKYELEHGDGILRYGMFDVKGWQYYTEGYGNWGLRGGSFKSSGNKICTYDRTYGYYPTYSRSPEYGIRGVRSF